jgi:hypothetical protein
MKIRFSLSWLLVGIFCVCLYLSIYRLAIFGIDLGVMRSRSSHAIVVVEDSPRSQSKAFELIGTKFDKFLDIVVKETKIDNSRCAFSSEISIYMLDSKNHCRGRVVVRPETNMTPSSWDSFFLPLLNVATAGRELSNAELHDFLRDLQPPDCQIERSPSKKNNRNL